MINEELAKQAKIMNSHGDYKENSATNKYNNLLSKFKNKTNIFNWRRRNSKN